MSFTKSEYGLIAEIHLIDQAPIANVFYVSGENWSNDEEVLINKNVDQWLRSFKFNDLLKLLIQSGNSLIQQDYVDDQATLFKNIRLISTEGQGEINGVVAFFNADFPFQEKSQQIAPYVTAVSTAIENLRLKRMSKIYEKELCLSPIPSLAMHCTNINSIFGLSPNINWKKLWEENEV